MTFVLAATTASSCSGSSLPRASTGSPGARISAGTLEPDWIKLAQVFPAELALGWLARKHGIEACILAHVVFNIAAFVMAEAGILRLG